MPPVQGGDGGGGGGGGASSAPGGGPGAGLSGMGRRFSDPPSDQGRQVNYLAVPSGRGSFSIQSGQDWWDPNPEPDPYSELLGLTKGRGPGGGGGLGSGFGGEPGSGGGFPGINISPAPPPPPPPPGGGGDPGGGGTPGGGGNPAASLTFNRPGQGGGSVNLSGPNLGQNVGWFNIPIIGPLLAALLQSTQRTQQLRGAGFVDPGIAISQGNTPPAPAAGSQVLALSGTGGPGGGSPPEIDASGRVFKKEPGYGLPYLEEYQRRLRRHQFTPSTPVRSNRPR